MFYDSKTQLIQFTDQLKGIKCDLHNLQTRGKKVKKKNTANLELNFPKIHSNIHNVCVS